MHHIFPRNRILPTSETWGVSSGSGSGSSLCVHSIRVKKSISLETTNTEMHHMFPRNRILPTSETWGVSSGSGSGSSVCVHSIRVKKISFPFYSQHWNASYIPKKQDPAHVRVQRNFYSVPDPDPVGCYYVLWIHIRFFPVLQILDPQILFYPRVRLF